MSEHNDTPQRLRSELLSWIRQNEETGPDWFLDEGEPAPLPQAPKPVETPASAPAVSAAASQVRETMAPALAADSAKPVPGPAPASDPDDPFTAVCETFVRDTLDLIRRHSAGRDPKPAPVETLEPIAAEVAGCTACALHATRQNTVFGAGHPNAALVFVGEAPGADEDRQGEPFVGRSGQLLSRIIESIGFTRDEVYICNILKCRPPNNRDPQGDEVAACESYLQRQLAVLRPRVICCLGRVAAQTLLNTDASLKRLRSAVHFYQDIPVMATYHPAALLRNPGWKRDTWEDVRKLRALHDALAGGPTD